MKTEIAEIICVEGRDDTAAVKRAVECDTIETHGWGISAETWGLLEAAYASRGLIIFTDPDHAGEEIRKRITAKFPGARQAWLDPEDARSGDDIGIENADPKAIEYALLKAGRTPRDTKSEKLNIHDLMERELVGCPEAAEKRRRLGKKLGIGACSGKAFLARLNAFGITKQEIDESL